MGKTALRILTDYFNVGDGKRPTREWAAEFKALTEEDVRELVDGVCAITGDTVVTK